MPHCLSVCRPPPLSPFSLSLSHSLSSHLHLLSFYSESRLPPSPLFSDVSLRPPHPPPPSHFLSSLTIAIFLDRSVLSPNPPTIIPSLSLSLSLSLSFCFSFPEFLSWGKGRGEKKDKHDGEAGVEDAVCVFVCVCVWGGGHLPLPSLYSTNLVNSSGRVSVCAVGFGKNANISNLPSVLLNHELIKNKTDRIGSLFFFKSSEERCFFQSSIGFLLFFPMVIKAESGLWCPLR